MQIDIIQGDITKMKVDAIVNAAKNSLLGGGGVDGAIHAAAGPAVLEECRRLFFCATGDAVYTTAGNLKSKYIIHTVGPVWNNNEDASDADNLLANCYKRSFEIAQDLGLKSIAFPNISTGIYGFPKERALGVVKQLMEAYSESTELDICIFCCFDEENFNLYKQTFTS